jgi:C-terminal processing protease CtpA/Prc
MPLIFFAENNELFVSKDLDGNLDSNKTYQLVSINGHSSGAIISKMLDYRPSDGYNQTFKYKLINSHTWFDKMYSYYFDTDSLKNIVLYENNSDTLRITRSLIPLKETPKANNSPISKKYSKYISLSYDSTKTLASLSIKSFSGFPILGKLASDNRYHKILKKLKNEKIPNLIIDLRNNTGGDALSGYSLASNFIDSDHTIYIQKHKGQIFKYANPGSRLSVVMNAMFGNLFSGRMPLFHDHMSKVKIKSKKKVYHGNVYILINGFTLSTASNVASIFKHKTDVYN